MTWPEVMARVGAVLYEVGDIACAIALLWLGGVMWGNANQRFRRRR